MSFWNKKNVEKLIIPNFARIRFILIFSSISFESGVLAPKLKSEPLGFSRVTSAEISLLKKKNSYILIRLLKGVTGDV